MLLVLLIIIPIIGALFSCFSRNRTINVLFITSAIVFMMTIFGLKGVFIGEPITFRIPLSGPFIPTLRADPLSVIFVILAAFLWLVVSIYAPKYMKHEGKEKLFDICTLVTLAAVLGVFMAGDLLTLLLFFELMTLASYFWVVHQWNRNAIKAGNFYLFYSITGGLILALGIVLLGTVLGGLPAIGTGSMVYLDSKVSGWGIALLVVGFGIKAGMAPLHIWLPHAHSAAPTPGSALLSGLLIKVGAYGLIRVGEFAGWGMVLESGFGWFGLLLVVVGICTMLTGVLAALLQSNAKRLLAYHSVSQMGYVILGLGLGLYLGSDGGLGLMGSIYHIVNHALFKTALFLGVGIIYINTGETNLYKLGGLWRRFPITAVLMLLAALGITGAPGLNGYASKTVLHHAVSMAAESGTPLMVWAERLFVVVGIGTAASFAKLYYLIFLGKLTKLKISNNRALSMKWAIGLLALVMVTIGLFPRLLLNVAVIPAAGYLGLKNAADTLAHISFWNSKDLLSMFVTLIAGVLVCWAGLRSGVFHWNIPAWLTLEGLSNMVRQGFSALWRIGVVLCRNTVSAIAAASKKAVTKLFLVERRFKKAGGGRIGWVTLTGIGADAALLIGALVILIVWYTLINPSLPGVKLPTFMTLFKIF